MVRVVWVWCGDKAGCGSQYRECWLKHLVRGACLNRPNGIFTSVHDTKNACSRHTQAHPDAAAPREGPTVPWTAGVVGSSLLDNADPATVRITQL